MARIVAALLMCLVVLSADASKDLAQDLAGLVSDQAAPGLDAAAPAGDTNTVYQVSTRSQGAGADSPQTPFVIVKRE